MRLDEHDAGRLVALVAANLHREYPSKIAHVLRGDGDVRPPRQLTPIFYGCFDWHSAVHSHWSLVRLVRLFPGARWARDVRARLAASFTSEAAAGERAYLEARPGFEMPYGIAWLLQLDAELAEARTDPELAGWRSTLAALVDLAGEQLAAWLARLAAPIRSGEHTQSAFAIGLALDWARATRRERIADLCAEKARELYQADRDAPVAYEPSAYDFLSPSLGEADLMRRVLGPGELVRWLDGFLPRLDRYDPVAPVDRADGKLVHWDGLNLSRAWMMRGIASALPPGERRAELHRRAEAHERAGLVGVTGEHYAGAHWLGSFAVYLLSDRGLSAAGPAVILAP
ncbi:MAG TPA: DUF2891 domain-containing protein [Kofleriaceae bacterium]|nr:DUF2891 domain-containing protein [Kofleriaceae bacterium]